MEKSKVYFCKEITPENIVKMFKVSGKELPGKVAVKLHSGEQGNEVLINRIESLHGVHTIEAAAELGLGTREYELITVE